jgi:hypothetical protein
MAAAMNQRLEFKTARSLLRGLIRHLFIYLFIYYHLVTISILNAKGQVVDFSLQGREIRVCNMMRLSQTMHAKYIFTTAVKLL